MAGSALLMAPASSPPPPPLILALRRGDGLWLGPAPRSPSLPWTAAPCLCRARRTRSAPTRPLPPASPPPRPASSSRRLQGGAASRPREQRGFPGRARRSCLGQRRRRCQERGAGSTALRMGRIGTAVPQRRYEDLSPAAFAHFRSPSIFSYNERGSALLPRIGGPSVTVP